MTSVQADAIVWVRRWRFEGVRILAALVVLALSVWATVDPPAAWEIEVFRVINDLPRGIQWALWPAQQAGMALAIPAGAVVLWFLVRHRRPPITLVAGGMVFGWGAAKLIKAIVERGRPAALLDNVNFGFEGPAGGLGFPSGHTVVAFTLAVVFSPYVPRWLRWGIYAFAAVVCVSRLFMGAHMPLDVVGGAAFGVIIGSAVNLTSGLREDKAKPEALALG